MSFQVGVDLGTTFTAAAVHRDGAATIFTLGSRSAAIPSVVLLREDGAFLTGDAAERRANSEPERVIREFKRRMGDPTPILVAGQPFTAEQLSAKLLESVVYEINRREGGDPGRIVITHPANWGAFKRKLLDEAVGMAGLDNEIVDFLTEPEAAALSYAAQERIHLGEVVAVYDLGGGTFDAAVLQRTETGFQLVGKPDGIERLGGIDFDAAVFSHVTGNLGDALSELDPTDPSALAAVSRLKQDCIDAKEALSSDTDARIPVLLPNLQTEVRITRHEFEALIRPSLMDSMEAMRRAIRSADLELDDVSRVLLVGGSSRIPLISQLVAIELGLPVAVDAHPKHAIALGAAFAAGGLLGRADAAEVAAAPKETPNDFNPNMTVVAPAHLLKAELGPRPTPKAKRVPSGERDVVPTAGARAEQVGPGTGPDGAVPRNRPSFDRPSSRTSADPAALDGFDAPAGSPRPRSGGGGGSGPGGEPRRRPTGNAPRRRVPSAFEDPSGLDDESASVEMANAPRPVRSEADRRSVGDDGRPGGPGGGRDPLGAPPRARPMADGAPPRARPVADGSPSSGRAGYGPSGSAPRGGADVDPNKPNKARPVPSSALSSPPPGFGAPPGSSSPPASGRTPPGNFGPPPASSNPPPSVRPERSSPTANASRKAQPVPQDRLSSPPPGFGGAPGSSGPPPSGRSHLDGGGPPAFPPEGGVMSRAGSLSGGGVDHRSHQPDPFHQAGVGGGYAPDQASGPGPVPVGAGGGSSSKAGWVVVALVLVALAVVGYIIYASAT